MNVIYNGNVSPSGTIHGSISDTIGFGGSAGIYGTGLPALYDDTAYWYDDLIISNQKIADPLGY